MSPGHIDRVIFVIGRMAWEFYSNMAVSRFERDR
jgi:hypothetical protein